MVKMQREVPIAGRKERRTKVEVKLPRVRMSAISLLVTVAVFGAVIFMVSFPLRNYMEQRAEIVRLTQSLQQLEVEKAQIQQRLEDYQSEAYIKEQARIRLGVTEPGEIAFRILDPDVENRRQTDNTDVHAQQIGAWYETLWDSVATPPEIEQPMPPADQHLPLAPVEN
ncbi:septum formation initiator family protein [Corynebacterium sp. HS2168-gen11]|uniref:FtsB family cell division protein n=1 Tax=Corynebacterium sp. HS2168-gen11 TaxID=2974027 RepID=UPI00216B6675|nr:septum formation initiator family protein [Corynebacterium sp. HS2168-gen11]MCS4534988.1 septum formation initiator family protein [Corynebacterium sp. HS2168-gen11]